MFGEKSVRVMSLKLEIEGEMFSLVSGYAPQVGCEKSQKEKFLNEVDEVMQSIPRDKRVEMGEDFSGHVGQGNRDDEEVMGRFSTLYHLTQNNKVNIEKVNIL